MASQTIGNWTVCTKGCSGTPQRKQQRSTLVVPYEWFPHKMPVMWKTHSCDDIIMIHYHYLKRWWIKTLRPRRNRCHFADDILKFIFFNENVLILIKMSLEFVPKAPINNIPALVQIMAWCRPGDKPLTEPVLVRLLMLNDAYVSLSLNELIQYISYFLDSSNCPWVDIIISPL